MIRVEIAIEIIIEISNDTARNGNRHSNNIDGDEQLVLHHAAPGNEEVVSDHVGLFGSV
jgi:hypothetical protein